VKLGKSKGSQNVASYPKNMGLSIPAKLSDYEFLIRGKDVPFIQNQIVKIFIEHSVGLLALDSGIDANRNEFVISICCDLEHADLGPMDLAVLIQTMKFVTSCEYCEMKGQLFGRQFPLNFNGKHRAVAVHSSVLMNIGRRLAKETGSLGTSALYQEGREYALNIVR